MKADDYFRQTAEQTILVQQAFFREEGAKVIQCAELLGRCFRQGGKVLIFGNGGSAADAQHMAAELVGRLLVERRPLPAISLTTDTSNLTALGNDFGFEQVFAKQVHALARKGDVIVALSTSGNSRNAVLGVEAAKEIGCTVIGMTGGTGGRLRDMCDVCLNVSQGKNSCRIQETHIFAIHSMVDLMDRFFLEEAPGVGE